MAILKIIAHGKRKDAKRQVLKYVLDAKKTNDSLCCVTGDFQAEQITPNSVFREFQRVRKLFNKDKKDSRTYLHGTVSFAPNEVQPEDAVTFAVEMVEQLYRGHQALVAVHIDTDHVHAHFVVEPVSYVDGAMLHSNKNDLAAAKEICNDLCRERGLSVARKGYHANGSGFAEGEITVWDKNKWHQMESDPKHSYLIDLALAVRECLAMARDREQFCRMMQSEFGWDVIWKDTKKHITFVNKEGHRVRDTNLRKTFNLPISKEELENELGRHGARTAVIQRTAERTRESEASHSATGSRDRLAQATASKRNAAKR